MTTLVRLVQSMRTVDAITYFIQKLSEGYFFYACRIKSDMDN